MMQLDLFAAAALPGAAPLPSTIPGPESPAGIWNAWVEAGEDRASRAARLTVVPAALRAGVEDHLVTVFELRTARRRQAPVVPAWRADLESTVAAARGVC